MTRADIQENALEYVLVDGVLSAVGRGSEVGISRPEKAELIDPWCVPSPLTGLGRQLVLGDVRMRAEHLAGCSDLAVRATGDPGCVQLQGSSGTYEGRRYTLRVVVDSGSGDVLSHSVYDSTWGAMISETRTPAWVTAGGARVPTRIEYRVFERALA